MNWLVREYRVFLSQPKTMRMLLVTNMVLALVLPVVDVFVSAYVMRMSGDVARVVGFQLALYTGIPLAFLANGFFLRKVPVHLLYSAGMLLIGASMLVVMWSNRVEPLPLALSGVFMGLSYGLFAANRAYLALETTNDRNRNYYYGLEMCCYTASSVLVPLVVGWLIEGSAKHGWFGGARDQAYAL